MNPGSPGMGKEGHLRHEKLHVAVQPLLEGTVRTAITAVPQRLPAGLRAAGRGRL